MDAKEQELVNALAEASRNCCEAVRTWNEVARKWGEGVDARHKWDELDRERDEASRNCREIYRNWNEARHELQKYQKSKALQGGKAAR